MATISEADKGGAADRITVQATSIPPVVITTPRRPSGPPPPAPPPQVLLHNPRRTPHDAAAAADALSVTVAVSFSSSGGGTPDPTAGSTTVPGAARIGRGQPGNPGGWTGPAADTAAAVDTPGSDTAIPQDTAGAADALSVTVAVQFSAGGTATPLSGFTSAPGAFRPGLGQPGAPGAWTPAGSDFAAAADDSSATISIAWTDTAAAADRAGTAGLGQQDTAGAADALSVAITAHLADTAGAADSIGAGIQPGASGGASTPQAYPGTSQVAVAAPGSSYWYYLGSIGQVTALTYSFTFPGGCDQLTCTVMVPASYRTQMFNPGWQVKVTRGGHVVWTGKLDEPVPTTSGWNLTAVGAGNLGTNFLAVYTNTWPADEPDVSINAAIGRGLPWVNPGVGSPAGAWFGQSVDPGAQTITDLLNLVCTRGGLAWYVNSQPGGYVGNDLAVFDLPSTPNRLLVCTTPVARTLGGDINSIFVRYEITADSTDSSGNSTPATYGLVNVENSVSVAAHGATETYIDLSDVGVMTAAQAEQVAAYVLEIYQRVSFAGPFTVSYGQLLNLGGVPVDPGADQAGNVCTAILTDLAAGGEAVPGPVSFIVGAYSWDDFSLTATVTPYQTLNMSLSGLLSMQNQLLTPITTASG